MNIESISPIATIALAVATVVLAIVAFRSIRIAERTLSATKRQQCFEFSPFLKVNVDVARALQAPLPEIGRTIQLWDLPQLKAWSDSEPTQPDRFIRVLFENVQKNPSGIAASVKFRVLLRFPEFGTPNSLVEAPREFTHFFLEPGETFELVIANLKGVPSATIDIDSIEYYDVYKSYYTAAYGYSRVDILGQQVVCFFKAFS